MLDTLSRIDRRVQRVDRLCPWTEAALAAPVEPPPFPEWLDLVSPGWPWHAAHLEDALYPALDRLTSGEIRKLMVLMPPRHMKSQTVTVRYLAWRLERDPGLRVILGAYGQTLANKFSRQVRRLVRARVPLNPERQAQHEWETLAGGGVRAAGVGAGITGGGASLIVIDDPVKSRAEADSPAYREAVWDWYTDDLYTRREGPDAQLILIMTRWHRDDLAGRILAGDDGPNWSVLSLPALDAHGAPLWPERFPVEELASIRASTSERTWLALYQQTPAAPGGVIFEAEWWDGSHRFDPETPAPCLARWLSWDTALVAHDDAAYTACVVVELGADRRLSLRDVYRRRLTFPELPQAMIELAGAWNRDGRLREVLIEDQASGTSAIQTLRATAPDWLRERIVGWKPRGSKEDRASRAAVWCRNGMVRLPQPTEAVPWLWEFERELLEFPHARWRDQVDAFSQAVIYLEPWIRQGYRPEGSDREHAQHARRHAAD